MRSFANAARELGVSRSAVSQSIRQLEEQLRVVLMIRTTRSLALTEHGRRLVESAGPSLRQTLSALDEISAQPGETVGRLRLTVPRMAASLVTGNVLSTFRSRHPRLEVEIAIEDRFVDIVAEGYDAGIRLSEALERDMVQVRLTEPFRFFVAGSPAYLASRGTPQRPEDLLEHDCINYRSSATGALYAWELERGKRTWRIPVRGGVVSNDGSLNLTLGEQGYGLVYADEPTLRESVRAGRLVRVLEPYAPKVPGYFLYFPSAARKSGPLRLFVETLRELGLPARANPTRQG